MYSKLPAPPLIVVCAAGVAVVVATAASASAEDNSVVGEANPEVTGEACVNLQEIEGSDVRAKASSTCTCPLLETAVPSVLASFIVPSKVEGSEPVIAVAVSCCRLWSPLGK